RWPALHAGRSRQVWRRRGPHPPQAWRGGRKPLPPGPPRKSRGGFPPAGAGNPSPAGLTVKFVVGFPAGGAQDIVGRVIADRLGALWKVPTVVENVAGAGGNLGIDRVAKGPADGTQICIIPPGLATNQFLYARLAYDPEKDIVPLAHV